MWIRIAAKKARVRTQAFPAFAVRGIIASLVLLTTIRAMSQMGEARNTARGCVCVAGLWDIGVFGTPLPKQVKAICVPSSKGGVEERREPNLDARDVSPRDDHAAQEERDMK